MNKDLIPSQYEYCHECIEGFLCRRPQDPQFPECDSVTGCNEFRAMEKLCTSCMNLKNRNKPFCGDPFGCEQFKILHSEKTFTLFERELAEGSELFD